MVNLVVIGLMLLAMKEILSLMIPDFFKITEEKLEFMLDIIVFMIIFFVAKVKESLCILFYAVRKAILFLIEISSPTQTEKVLYRITIETAKTEHIEDKFRREEFVNQKLNFKLHSKYDIKKIISDNKNEEVA